MPKPPTPPAPQPPPKIKNIDTKPQKQTIINATKPDKLVKLSPEAKKAAGNKIKEMIVKKDEGKPTRVNISKDDKEKKEIKLKQYINKPILPKKTKAEIAASPMKAIKDVQDSVKSQTEETIKMNEKNAKKKIKELLNEKDLDPREKADLMKEAEQAVNTAKEQLREPSPDIKPKEKPAPPAPQGAPDAQQGAP